MACWRAAQEVPITKWQPEETTKNEDDRQTPTIMTELLQAKKVINRDFENEIEESEKRIKRLLRPGEKLAMRVLENRPKVNSFHYRS